MKEKLKKILGLLIVLFFGLCLFLGFEVLLSYASYFVTYDRLLSGSTYWVILLLSFLFVFRFRIQSKKIVYVTFPLIVLGVIFDIFNSLQVSEFILRIAFTLWLVFIIKLLMERLRNKDLS